MDESYRLPWSERAGARLGHHANAMLMTGIVAVVLVGLRPLPGPFAYTVPLALVAWVLISWVLMREHDRRLCEQCALAMPLNPAGLAVRHRRRLSVAHAASQPRLVVPYLVVLIGSNFADGSSVGRLGWAVIQLSMVYLLVSYSTHRRLQPWCPQCRGDGGGEDVDTTPPVVPHDDRQLI